MAKTRLVETDEDVETYRPVLDAIKTAIGDRQAELARLEGEPAIVGGMTPLALSGGNSIALPFYAFFVTPPCYFSKNRLFPMVFVENSER